MFSLSSPSVAKGERRAQDAYLIVVVCDVAFQHVLGRTSPMRESSAAPIWLAAGRRRRPEKKEDQPGTKEAASHTAITSVAYRISPWGELT